jgi:hypothetical protein
LRTVVVQLFAVGFQSRFVPVLCGLVSAGGRLRVTLILLLAPSFLVALGHLSGEALRLRGEQSRFLCAPCSTWRLCLARPFPQGDNVLARLNDTLDEHR